MSGQLRENQFPSVQGSLGAEMKSAPACRNRRSNREQPQNDRNLFHQTSTYISFDQQRWDSSEIYLLLARIACEQPAPAAPSLESASLLSDIILTYSHLYTMPALCESGI
jgi:hypothetical protein